MTLALTSEVTQLLYRATPNLNFARVIGDLCALLTLPDGFAPVPAWDCDDIAVLDLGAARLVIGFSDQLPGLHSACVTIASGLSPQDASATLTKSDQVMLCQQVAARLDRRFPSDAQKHQTLNDPLTPDVIDRVVEALLHTQAPVAEPEQTAHRAAPPPVAVVAPTDAEPGEMERLMGRLASELTARTPNLISRVIASASTKGRGAADIAQPLATSAARKAPDKTAKAAGGLFWRRDASSRHPQAEGAPNGPLRTPASELKAVRDALCAEDVTQTVGVARIAAQTRLALKTLAALPRSLAGSALSKPQRDATRPDNPIKH